MGGFANILSGANTESDDTGTKNQVGKLLQQVGGIGAPIAKIGNAASGHVSPGGASPVSAMGGVPATTPTTPMIAPAVAHAMQGNVAGTNQVKPISTPGTGAIPTQASPVMPTATAPGQAPVVPGMGAGVGTIGTGAGEVNPGDFTSVYGVDTGTMIQNLFNSLGPNSANSTAQAIIAANAPNVAKGSADLNTALAAGGISPSSSVSAIENADYQGQVQQQNLAQLANINLTEQERQQQLLETLLPTQQQRQTDSSGWSIFGDIMSGVGDIGSLVAGL